MSDTTTTRKINIWINGKEVENNFKSITAAMAQAKNQLAKMEVGSKAYFDQIKKIQQLKGHIDNHIKNINGVGSAWQKVKSNIMQIGVGNFLGNIFTNVLGTISNAFSEALTKIKEFASGISDLKAITGLTAKEDIELLKNNIMDLSAQYGISAKEIVEAYKLVGSARPELLGSVEALTEMTDQVIILSKASGLNLVQSTEALAGSLSQLHQPASEAANIIDILATAAQKGSKEIPYMSTFLLKSGEIAYQSNLNLRDVATTAQLLGPAFKSPEEAATAFNSVLKNLKNQGLGFGSGKFSMSDALNEVSKKLDGMSSEADKAKYTNKLFGDGLTAGMILLDKNAIKVGENVSEFDKFKDQLNETGSALKMANERMDNWQGDIDKLGGAWDKLILSLDSGDGVITRVIRNSIQGFTNLIKAIEDINKGQFWKEKLKRDSDYIGQLDKKWKEYSFTLARAGTDEYKRAVANKKIIDLTTSIKMNESKMKDGKDEYGNLYNMQADKMNELRMENDMYNDLIIKLNEYKATKLDVNKTTTDPNAIPVVDPEKDVNANTNNTSSGSGTKHKVDELKDYKKAYEDLRKQILQMRQKYNLEDLSEEDKAIAEIENKYQEQLDVVDRFITELETKQATKEGLNSDELDLLSKFYDQKSNLISLREYEIEAVNKDFDAKKLEEKKKIEEQIFDITASASEKERAEILKKYQDLIKAAELYGIDTVELYKKMNTELASLALGGGASAIESEGEKKDIFGMTPKDWEDLGEHFEKAMKYADAAKGMVSAFFELQSNKEAAALQQYEENTAKKKEALQKQLDSGKISQENYNKQVSELDNKLNIEKKKGAIADANRSKKMRRFDAIMNTAAAVIGFLANPGGIFGLGLSLMAGITGGIQIAAINKEAIPKLAKGKRVNKRMIAEIGEAGPEIVLSNGIVSDPTYGPIADDLARIQEGKKPNFLGKPNMPNYSGMNNAIGGGSSNVVTTNNTTINQVDNKSIDSMKSEISEMKKHIVKMTDSVTKLKYLKAVISQDDQKDFDDDEKIRLRYSGI